MNSKWTVALLALAAWSLVGCPSGGDDGAGAGDKATAGAAKSTAPYRAGRIRLDDKTIPVDPNVHHVAEMDLYIACKRVVADAAESDAADQPPLCYGADKRATPPKSLRIEHRESMPSGDGITYLRELNESAHFIVDKSGAIYQSLDLVWPVRRAGAIRADELRVLSGSATGHQALFAALAEMYPDLRVDIVAAPTLPPDHKLKPRPTSKPRPTPPPEPKTPAPAPAAVPAKAAP